MKKVLSTAIAASIVAAAGAAGAAVSYNNDNFSYTLKGDWDIRLSQDIGTDEELDMKFDDLEFKNRIEYALYDGAATAFGQVDFGFKNAGNATSSSGHLEEAYLGFSVPMEAGSFDILMGKTASPADDFDVSVDIAGTVDTNAFPVSSGDDLIKVSAAFGPVNVAAGYELEADGKSSGDGTFFDIYADLSVAGATLVGVYQSFEPAGADDSVDTFGVSVSYDAGFAALGIAYSSQEDAVDVTSVGLEVPLDAVTLGVGYDLNDNEDGTENSGWYVNVTYAFPTASNVSLYAEIGDSDIEEYVEAEQPVAPMLADNAPMGPAAGGSIKSVDTDLGFLVGLRIKF